MSEEIDKLIQKHRALLAEYVRAGADLEVHRRRGAELCDAHDRLGAEVDRSRDSLLRILEARPGDIQP